MLDLQLAPENALSFGLLLHSSGLVSGDSSDAEANGEESEQYRIKGVRSPYYV